ncbi:MAG: dihydroorotase [Nitrospirota bacterium]
MTTERNWLITGGRLIDPAQKIDGPADLLIIDGKVAKVGKSAEWKSSIPADCQRIDAAGCWLAPGFIDLHTHLREPGYEYKETIESGGRAAAAGGFTTICCMPNTNPINDNRSVTELIIKQARQAGAVQVLPVGAITKGSRGEELAEIGELLEAGCVAVSDDGRPVMNSQLMRRAMEYAKGFGGLVIDHCEDLNLSAGGCMHEGAVSLQLGLHGIPAASEEAMVARDLALVALTGCRFHVAHVSSAGSVRMVREAKAQGLPVTAETCPHYLALTDEAVLGYRTHAKMNPPLRGRGDQEALIEALADGAIDAIATDHAPHAAQEKEQEFDRAPFGIIGLETAFSVCYDLVRRSLLTPARLIEALTASPAAVIRSSFGTLPAGAAADLVIIDPDEDWVADARRFQSKSRNSPFEGWTLHGRVLLTMAEGRIVHGEADLGRQPAAAGGGKAKRS